ncbi:MAG: FAD-dependent oxidoreductase [Erythrobacter sp.]|uniref:NAD(P)/FAD-dependent oxidoreductase n=1 Tax=Erythrobacter sp. TaxID=1042 RepID=UPI003C745DD2
MNDTVFDFAIIGGGMAGASLGAELAPHSRVLVLEAEDVPGYHATGRSAAFWEECYGGPEVVPLTLASGAYLREHGFLRERGALYVGREEDRAALDAFMDRFADTGATIERLDADRLHARVPQLREKWCDAIFEPACADIDVAGLHQHYLSGLKSAGGKLVCRAPVEGLEQGSREWRISTRAAEFRARTVIDAAGAWADDVATLCGAKPLGIEPKRRTVVQLRVDPEAPADLPLVLDISGRFYFKPDSGRLWLSPHDEIPAIAGDAVPEELDVATAIDRFEQVTQWDIKGVERRWAGLRSFAPDRLPVYGPDPVIEDFFWFAGQGGFGIQTAPAAARLAAQVLLDAPRDSMTRDLDPEMYSPARFGPGRANRRLA